jgi:hypothetical protein
MLSRSPASFTSERITPSAVGDLQMLPRHTNSTRVGRSPRRCPDAARSARAPEAPT